MWCPKRILPLFSALLIISCSDTLEPDMYPCNFTRNFDSRMLRFVDKRYEYLSPGQIGGKYKCCWKYLGLRPGRTCAAMDCYDGATAYFAVIITPGG